MREPVQKIDRAALHDRVYGEIRRALMEGDFQPGTIITLQSLAQEVGTSIMPVRDALRRLVAERALDLLPNRLIAVPVMTPERLGEIRDIRLALESLATALAAVRIADREVAALAGIFEILHGQRRPPPPDCLALTQDFHFTIYRDAGRPTLHAMIETLWLQTGPLFNAALRRSARRPDPQHYHAVLGALRMRDGKAAGRAVAAAILAQSDLMVEVLRAGDPSV